MRPIHTLLLASSLLIAPFGAAQSTPDQSAGTSSKAGFSAGPTAFVLVGGNYCNMGVIESETLDVGYDFTPRLGADIGLPLYTTRTPFSVVAKADWRYTTIIGAPYLDLRYSTKRGDVNVVSVLSLSGGTRSIRTYSVGRAIVDWYNHFDRPYIPTSLPVVFTPFLNLGAASGTFDRAVLPSPFNIDRPYQVLGALGNGEAGANLIFQKRYRLGGSAYGLLPVGQQKVFSRLVSPDSLLAAEDFVPSTGLPSHNRWWNDYFETAGSQFGSTAYTGGPSRIARDNGFSGWLEVTRFKHFDVELGYTRSVHYAYGSAFVMIRYDLTHFLRAVTIGE